MSVLLKLGAFCDRLLKSESPFKQQSGWHGPRIRYSRVSSLQQVALLVSVAIKRHLSEHACQGCVIMATEPGHFGLAPVVRN